jgi:hypothetical protein
LANDACTYAVLRDHLVERFSEKLPAQYHYKRLQDATQEKGEIVDEFADRFRRLCQNTVRKVADEATQRVINEEAERPLVAAYINGLVGVVGQQVRFLMPHTLEEAVQVAVTISNAERLKATDTKRVFSARGDNRSQNITCYNCGKKVHYARDCRSLKWDSHVRDQTGPRKQGVSSPGARNSSTAGRQAGKQVRCFYCKKLGHRKDQCPQILAQTSASPNSNGSAMRSPKSTQGQQEGQRPDSGRVRERAAHRGAGGGKPPPLPS